MKFRLIMVIIVFAMLNIANARNISGSVISIDSTPVEFATVVLMTQDSVYVNSCVTSETGQFEISDPNGTGRIIEIQYVGFRPKRITFDESEQADINLGRITMDNDSNVLSEVTVTARKPMAKMKGNALVTTIENSILSLSGTANDVLSQLPTVSGQNGEFKVLGRGTPIIYINGRLIRSNIELEQLKSSDIKTVEVISDPGVRYNSSVNSVIRITTKSGGDNGWSLGGRTINRFNHHVSTTNNLDVNYRHNQLDVFAVAQISNKIVTSEETYSQISESSGTSYRQYMISYNKTDKLFLQGKIGFNLQLNRNHSLGAWYSNDYSKTRDRMDYSCDISAGNMELENTRIDSHGADKTWPDHNASLYYSGKINKLTIDFNADMTKSKMPSSSVQYEDIISNTDSSRSVFSQSVYKPEFYAQKLVMSYPLWHGEIQFGEETSWTHTYTSVIGDGYVLKSSDSKAKETNSGYFITLNQKLGTVNIGAGLRYEHTSSKYYSDGKIISDQSKTYNNLFPTVRASTNFGDVGINLSYTDRMQRPSYTSLSSTTTYINRILYKRGNPYLRPSRDRQLSLQALWRDLFGQVTFVHHQNAISTVYLPYNNSATVSLFTYSNLSSFNEVSFAAVYSPKFGIWRPSLQANVCKQWFHQQINGVELRLDDPIINAQFRNTITLPEGIMLNINMSWQSSGNLLNYHASSFSNLYVRVYKYFLNKRVGVFLEANDLLKKSESGVSIYSGPIYSVDKVLHDTRYVQLSLSFNFNVKDSKYKGKGAGSQERNRLTRDLL